jgi:hypothetical protein
VTSFTSTTRSILGITALTAAIVVVAVRSARVPRNDRIELGPRAEEFAYVMSVASRVEAYAIRYGRPIYRWDLKQRYLSAAESTEVAELRAILWGGPVAYVWNDSAFWISWLHPDRPSVVPKIGSTPRYTSVSHKWPASASAYARARRIASTPR